MRKPALYARCAARKAASPAGKAALAREEQDIAGEGEEDGGDEQVPLSVAGGQEGERDPDEEQDRSRFEDPAQSQVGVGDREPVDGGEGDRGGKHQPRDLRHRIEANLAG